MTAIPFNHALLPVRDGFGYYAHPSADTHARNLDPHGGQGDLHQCRAIVPDDLYLALRQFQWSTDSRGYVKRRERVTEAPGIPRNSRRLIYLQQAIMGHAPEGMVWTFLDRDARNCTRENLVAVPTGYAKARGNACARNPTGHKGVTLRGGKYYAAIGKGCQQYHLGAFDDLEGAVYARAAAEVDLYGELASPEAWAILHDGVELSTTGEKK